MKPPIEIKLAEARKLALSQQGLLKAQPKFGRGKKAVLRAIEHLGYVQIDAISVIQRAHHHTLWSRIPGYKPKYLLDLLNKDRQIFEYWSHAASFLPIRDFRYALPVMQSIQEKGKHWYQVEPEIKSAVLDRITLEGPLYARDFETPKLEAGIMWNWKPAKKALHELFMEGKVTVKSRDGFQRLYEVTERFVPDHIDTSIPSYDEYLWFCIQQCIKAQALCTVPEIRYQRIFSNKALTRVIHRKVEQGSLIPVTVDSLKQVYYSLPEVLTQLPLRSSQRIHLLSPFDNMVIQRKRLKDLFDFDYQTEIYYPAHKRVYGYFSMPILHGTSFIGRIDPKAHRETKHLEIRNLVLEDTVRITDAIVEKLKHKLQEFCRFNDCETLEIRKTNPGHLKSTLSSI